MNKQILKKVAKLLTVHGFRNSYIEDVHADGRLSQKEMKKLNKEVCNQIYTLLYMLENGKLSPFFTNEGWTSKWDEPKLVKGWVKTK